MPNAYGRAFTTANFLPNLAALKAINFGASDPSGVWFLVKNPTGNSDIWLWEPTSTAAINETSVVRPDSIPPGSPGRCVKSLVDANSLGGILAAIALLNTAGLIERTADGSAAIVGLGAFARTFLGSASDSVARTTLDLGNVTNTSDANKPVSIAQQTALNLKADLINGTVPAAQLPSFVDDILEFATLASFPATGEAGKLYVAINTNLVYRWTGTIYVAISDSLALGITSSSAYRGDFGNTAYLHSQETGNPHGTTAAQIGLPNLTNHLQVNTTENQTIGGEKTFTEIVRITNTTESTSTTTGAHIVDGGQAVAGNLTVGGTIKQAINYTFRAALLSDQSIPAATFTKINLTTEVIDTNNQYNAASARLTANTTEFWQLFIFITYNIDTPPARIIQSIFKNNSEFLRVVDTTVTGNYSAIPVTILEVGLVAGDYLEMFCYMDVARSVYGDATLSATYWYGKRIN